MKIGDKYTIAGTGTDENGAVLFGRSLRTGKFAKPERLIEFTVVEISTGHPETVLTTDHHATENEGGNESCGSLARKA